MTFNPFLKLRDLGEMLDEEDRQRRAEFERNKAAIMAEEARKHNTPEAIARREEYQRLLDAPYEEHEDDYEEDDEEDDGAGVMFGER